MISFVCGMLCAGKTLYSSALAEITKGKMIEIGDIVRTIKKSNDRAILQNTAELDKLIIDEIALEIEKVGKQDVIISGARQVSVVDAFPEATLLWIDCPTDVRKSRYYARQREGDCVMSFEQAEEGDIALGILDVKEYIYYRTP